MDKQLEQGFHIVMAGERAIIGKDYVMLSDHSALSFVTDNPTDFKDYLNHYIAQKVILVFNESSIKAVPAEPKYENLDYLALCKMRESPAIELIRRMYDQSIVASNFERFLYTMRKYYDIDGKKLYDQVRHLTIKKVTKIEKVSDNQGNFHYCVSRTGDQSDMEPTPQISFKVPMYQRMSEQVTVSFDVHLEYKEIEGGVVINYRLVNPFFEDELNERKLEIVVNHLIGVDRPVFQGNTTLNKITDEWSFKENGID